MNLKEILLQALESQLDPSVQNLIQSWDDTPKAIQVLEALDQCVRYSSGSGFVVIFLHYILEDSIKQENTTYEEIVKLATWRQNG